MYETSTEVLEALRLKVGASLLVQIRGLGELGPVDRAFDGFGLARGQLWTPEGASVSPGEMRALPLLVQLVRELERERRAPRQFDLFSASALAPPGRLHQLSAPREPVALAQPSAGRPSLRFHRRSTPRSKMNPSAPATATSSATFSGSVAG